MASRDHNIYVKPSLNLHVCSCLSKYVMFSNLKLGKIRYNYFAI